MSVGEREANNWLRANVLRPGDRMTRIENAVSAGLFDVNYCIEGVEGWIELKAPRTPVYACTPLFGSNHKFSQEQKNFALAQRRAGGVCWAFINTDEWRILVPGKMIEHINTMTLPDVLEEAYWKMHKGSPLAERVASLRETLTTKGMV